MRKAKRGKTNRSDVKKINCSTNFREKHNFLNFLSIFIDGSPFATVEFPDFQFSKLNQNLKPLARSLPSQLNPLLVIKNHGKVLERKESVRNSNFCSEIEYKNAWSIVRRVFGTVLWTKGKNKLEKKSLRKMFELKKLWRFEIV